MILRMMRFDGDPVTFEYKQCIVVRTDLHLSKGKLAAQAAHAALSACDRAKRSIRDSWKVEGQKKVILAVDSLDELFELEEEAKRVDLPTARIEDAGLTEVPRGTITALGIGPAKNRELDKITGHMKLL
ncbi:peptidyl-tRNA hydrolase Pth2 [Halobacteriota archaeon]